LVLASRSPPRRAILAQLGIEFEIRPADVPERDAGAADEVVTENAIAKARAIAASAPDATVIGVDTEVELDGELFGKAGDEREAARMLRGLSGRRHRVWSGLCLIESGRERTGTACTLVTFRSLDPGLLDWYVAGGEWRDRAGAYAIQGRGAALVERVEGDFWNVVGLPVALLLDMAPELVT
jgi:septum formation protein